MPPAWSEIKAKMVAQPLIPLGALTTAGILVGLVLSFSRGNKQLTQRLMRHRVTAQFATLGVIGVATWNASEGGMRRNE